MDELKSDKRKWLARAVISMIIGAVSIAGIIFFILKLRYFPMAVCIALTAHAFYGCPFYFIAYSNAKKREVLFSALEKGEDFESAAKAAGVTADFAKRLTKGYIITEFYQEDNLKEN